MCNLQQTTGLLDAFGLRCAQSLWLLRRIAMTDYWLHYLRLAFFRFMLFQTRIELAMAIAGGNRTVASIARQHEIHWEGELDKEYYLWR